MRLTVVTPTYNTDPAVLARTWSSLKAQTYTDWDWLVYDDSTTGSVWQQLWGICSDERYTVTPIRGIANCGSIGRVKRRAFMAAEGDILVELDHDDELTPDALEKIHEAFARSPDVGFVYSDWSEHFADGTTGRYPAGWAYGYGGEYQDGSDWVMKAPPVNRVTASHIVSVPNHVRAWRADLYRQIGGHNPTLPVADDYELLLRTFLATDWAYIPERLYKQHIGAGTAQRTRNAQIQVLVKELSEQYSERLDARFGPLNQQM